EEGGNNIGRITTAGVFTEFAIATSSTAPFGIAAGPDGNLWFTEENGNNVGRVTTTGIISEFPILSQGRLHRGITAGPDGNVRLDPPIRSPTRRPTTGRSPGEPLPIARRPRETATAWESQPLGPSSTGTRPSRRP